MGRFAGLFLILTACSGGDDRRAADASGLLDSGVGDGGVAPDAPSGSDGGLDGWSLDIDPRDGTRRISLEPYGDGLLLVEHASSPLAFHRISDTGVLAWTWEPSDGDVRHFATDSDAHLHVVASVDIGAGRGNRTLFVSVDGADGTERWVTAEDFTLGWCRGVCAVEANNREYIADIALSEGSLHYSGRYTADPRHLFGTLDLATGANDSNTTSDRVNHYRYLYDVPGPSFIGIRSATGAWEQHLLSATWMVQSTTPSASEDQHVEHPMGLVTFVAASGELVLIDETATVVSQVPWTPPAMSFELAAATADSLVVTHADAGSTFVGVALSTGTTEWEATFAADATSAISDATVLVAEPRATAFDVTRLDRTDGTTTAEVTAVAELCELLEGNGLALAIAELADGAFAAHCAAGAMGTPVIRVRELSL